MWPPGFPAGSAVKNRPAMQETRGSVLVSRRSPGEENGNPRRYSCLGNPTDRGAWRAPVHGVTGVGNDWLTTKTTTTRSWNVAKSPARASAMGTPSVCFLGVSSPACFAHVPPHALHMYHTSLPSHLHASLRRGRQASGSWDSLIHCCTTGILNHAWHPGSAHKILLKENSPRG